MRANHRRPEDLSPSDLERLRQAHKRLRDAVKVADRYRGVELRPGVEVGKEDLETAYRDIDEAEPNYGDCEKSYSTGSAPVRLSLPETSSTGFPKRTKSTTRKSNSRPSACIISLEALKDCTFYAFALL